MIDKIIKDVGDKFPFPELYNTKRYKNIVETVVRLFPKKLRILDFGSGPSEIPAILNQLQYTCVGYDNLKDEWLNKDNNRDKVYEFMEEFGVEFQLATSYSMPFVPNSFDVFMMNDVLEHLHDSPRDLLNDAVELLSPKGYIFITVPSIVNIRKRISVLLGKTNLPDYETFYWYPDDWRGPVREYTKGDLTQMCDYLGLDIIDLRGCHHMLDRVPDVLLPFYKAITAVFPNWRDTWLLVAQKPDDWKPRRNINEEEFKAIMQKTKWEQRKKEKLF